MASSSGSGWFSRIVDRVFGAEIARRVNLAVKALDDARDVLIGSGGQTRDRYVYDREQQLRDSLTAWRDNPLARRIVALTTQYVVGGGIWPETKNEAVRAFVAEFWEHRLNRMLVRVYEWCDELSRSGELFVVVTTLADGTSLVRSIPALDIQIIEHADNDLEQETVYVEKPRDGETEGRRWPAYNSQTDALGEDGRPPQVMLHYAINRPVGALRGESDLAPLLKWLSRYSAWLEDRVRLNRFRQTFMFIVSGKWISAAARAARQAELNLNPPPPGSILVKDDDESWGILHPQLDSFEASEDGLSVKKMVAAGSGNPLHFLAEPEGSNRSTAEAAGGPTYRHYQQRQIFFLWLVKDLLKVVIARARLAGRRLSAKATVEVRATDISARDNSSLALSAQRIVQAFGDLYNRGLVDEAELLRLAYTFAGEVVDVNELLKRIVPPRVVQPVSDGGSASTGSPNAATDPESALPVEEGAPDA